jgi:adenine nucleotide transporter 17
MPERVASEVLSAMVGGMFSASALYPLEVLKTRMQAESKPSSNPQDETTDDNNENDEEKTKLRLKNEYIIAASEGMTSYASLMYQYEGGIRPFYSGLGTSALQSATEKALYFFAYTFFKNG